MVESGSTCHQGRHSFCGDWRCVSNRVLLLFVHHTQSSCPAWYHAQTTARCGKRRLAFTARHPRPLLPSLPAGCPDGQTLCGGSCVDGCCTTENKPGVECGTMCINPETQVRSASQHCQQAMHQAIPSGLAGPHSCSAGLESPPLRTTPAHHRCCCCPVLPPVLQVHARLRQAVHQRPNLLCRRRHMQ